VNKDLKITLKVDAKTGEVTAVRNSFDKLDRAITRTRTSSNALHMTLLKYASIGTAIYGIKRAFDFVTESGLEYNKAMDASRAKLTAMISAAKDYKTVSGEQVDEMQRQKLIAAEVNDMMQILGQTNAQTAMGMSELVDIYALAKPGMDRYNWAVKDQIEIVKLASNTASNFGMTAEELQSGIDDLAAGTWEVSSGFGKMMKAIGVSKEEYAAAADKVAYLKEKMKETGAAQDTWAVAVSNFEVAWDQMTGKITQPVFNGIKEAIKEITGQMNQQAPDAMQVFADALVDMVNGGIQAVSTLISWVSKLISGFRIAYAGYKKLAGAARVFWNGDNDANAKELAELNKKLAEARKSGIGVTRVLADIRALKADMEDSEAGARLWAEADKDLADIAKFDAKLQGVAHTIEKIKISKGAVSSISQAINPADKLANKTHSIAAASSQANKNTKSHARSITTAAKRTDDLYKKYLKLTGQTEKLFELDVQETLGAFEKSGKYTAQQLSDIYDAMWEKYAKKGKEANESILQTLQTRWGDVVGNLAGAYRSGGISAVGEELGNMAINAANSIIPGLGTAIDTIGALFSSTVSQAEIDAASGTSSFDAHAFEEMTKMLNSYMEPQLTASEGMLQHLESMDEKFGSIAVALTSSTGFDYDGSEFTPTSSSSLWGGKSTELISAGLKFQEQSVGAFLDGLVDVDGFQAVLKKKSSFFGLVKSEKIVEESVDVPQQLKDDLSSALHDGIQATLDGLEILGFDTQAIEQKLQEGMIDLGKLNFKDLNAEEKQQLLNDAMANAVSEATRVAVNAVAAPENIAALDDARRAGEDYITTIARLAVQHETVTTQFAMFGQSVTDFTTSNVLVEAAGGLDQFKSAMATFTKNFFTPEEQQEMLGLQLQMALQTQNVALPASKAQFKALVLETQQKIINLKAKISAMKAEAMLNKESTATSIKMAQEDLKAKAKMAKAQTGVIKDQVNANNNLIKSQNEAGKATIAFGKNVNNSIKAIAGKAVSAVEGGETVSLDSITTPEIEAAEAELANLEALYGTLMQNMDGFAEYYGGMEDTATAATAASEKLSDLEKSLVSIANLKAVWGNDEISAKKIILDATKRYTGLTDLTYENFLEKFEAATADGLGMDNETLQAWQDMSNALRALHDVEQKQLEEEKNKIRQDITFYEDVIESIRDAYTGTLSYLSSVEKTAYLSDLAKKYKSDGDNENYISTLQKQLEEEKRSSRTKEEYAEKFDKYIQELQKQKPKKTTDDVVESLEVLEERLIKIEDAIEEAAYRSNA